MKIVPSIFFIAFSLLSAQAPKYEVRAVWLSTAGGDWPSSTDRREQQRSLAAIFDRLERNHFNTVFFQVRPRGNTYYRSEIEPWANHLTGTLGGDPGWDPLQFAIDEARKRGMELHAWFNVAKVWGLDTPPSHPKHLFRTHRDWLQQVDGEWWIDMGIPGARAYTEQLVVELAEQYDLDGIHFDFIRYPGEALDDWKSFTAWGDGTERDEWRRNNITAFVRNCYERVHEIAPQVKIGSAPVGIYRPFNGAQSTFTGYAGVYQDSRRWLREGIHDYLVPQIYWSIGEQQEPNDPDFSSLCFDWTREQYGRHVYAGIGIYRDNVRPEAAAQVLVSRWNGMEGEAFFRYEQLPEVEEQLASVYGTKALIPPMPWKDSIPPLPPENIAVSKNAEGKNVVRWNRPAPARDQDRAFRYVVYRSTRSPVEKRSAEHIAAIVPGTVTAYTDEAPAFAGTEYSYTVTSLDRNWNESGGEMQADGFAILLKRYSAIPGSPVVSQNYPEPFASSTYLSLMLPKSELVTITVRPEGVLRETTVVREKKKAGRHIIGMNIGSLPPGIVECTIRIGAQEFRRIFTKK